MNRRSSRNERIGGAKWPLWWLRGSQLKSKERHLTADENHSHVALCAITFFGSCCLRSPLRPSSSLPFTRTRTISATASAPKHSQRENGNYIVGPRAALAKALGLIRLSI